MKLNCKSKKAGINLGGTNSESNQQDAEIKAEQEKAYNPTADRTKWTDTMWDEYNSNIPDESKMRSLARSIIKAYDNREEGTGSQTIGKTADMLQGAFPKTIAADVKQALIYDTLEAFAVDGLIELTPKYVRVTPELLSNRMAGPEQLRSAPRTTYRVQHEAKFNYKPLYHEDGSAIRPPVAGKDVLKTVAAQSKQRFVNVIPTKMAVKMARDTQNKVRKSMEEEAKANRILGIPTSKVSRKKEYILSDDYIKGVYSYFTMTGQMKGFYLDTSLDTRMRFYYRNRYANPQGTDFEKAAITFAEDLAYNARQTPETTKWLKVHFANLAGKDKGEYADYDARVEWFDKNIKSPADSKKLVDYPMMAAVQLQLYFMGKHSMIPVAVDATSSGPQIASVLMGDYKVIGKYTNVGDNPLKKDDLYGAFVDTWNKEKGTHPLVSRKTFKWSVMSYLYGASEKSIIREVQKQLTLAAVKADKTITPAESKKIGQWFFKQIDSPNGEYATLGNFRRILSKAYDLGGQAQATILFPNGQIVDISGKNKYAFERGTWGGGIQESISKGDLHQNKIHAGKTKVGTRDNPKDALFSIPSTSMVTHFRKGEAQRLMPANFVQAVKAYLMHYVASRMGKMDKPFIDTHDSYASRAEDVPLVQKLYAEGMKTLIERRYPNAMNFMEYNIHKISRGKLKP